MALNLLKLRYWSTKLSFLYEHQLINQFVNGKQVFSFSTSSQKYFPTCTSTFLAGHSHWQNVRHVKEASDKEKRKNVSKFIRIIGYAIKSGGSRDPNTNASLASAIKQALDANVPKATIERFLASDGYTDPYIIEAKGGGGIFFLFESCNKHVKRERDMIKSYLKKFGCDINDTNTGHILRDFFTHNGFIIVQPDNEKIKCLDSATEIGIEVGVEDVEPIEIDGTQYFQFQVAPSQINAICSELEKLGVTIYDYGDIYIPSHTVQVSPDIADSLDEMYSRIKTSLDTVSRIFDNIERIET